MKRRLEDIERGEDTCRRIPGGTGFADAIFRKQADSNDYARGMLERTLRRLGLEAGGYGFFESESGFLIKKGQQIVLEMTFDEVEDCRALAVHALEEKMEEKLRSLPES